MKNLDMVSIFVLHIQIIFLVQFFTCSTFGFLHVYMLIAIGFDIVLVIIWFSCTSTRIYGLFHNKNSQRRREVSISQIMEKKMIMAQKCYRTMCCLLISIGIGLKHLHLCRDCGPLDFYVYFRT